MIKIPQPEKSKAPENTLPMINVIFLLLIFFMLAGAFTRPEPFAVQLPNAAQLADLQREEQLLYIAGNGEIALNQRPLSLDELAAVVANWQGQPLQVKADADMPAERLIAVVEVLAEAGISQVQLLAERVE
ncbi:MAG: hypothetical protein CSA54_03485 [Gammaproteobacteria bacterium]|nr:MAG: hypothetical protein CSA54_03485 [Gammaproteobacteria bacterium]